MGCRLASVCYPKLFAVSLPKFANPELEIISFQPIDCTYELFSQHKKCNTNPIVSDPSFVGLYCLQGLHSLDSANQVEVFTEPSVCPQA